MGKWKRSWPKIELNKLASMIDHPMVYPEPNTGCWLWGRTQVKGYGLTSFRKKVMTAHRASWLMERGDIPDGLWVLHRCNTPLCVNPEHLYLGTAQDNYDYMEQCGRRGVTLPKLKLSASQVSEIRKLIGRETGETLAVMYGVTRATISRIKHNKAWRHV